MWFVYAVAASAMWGLEYVLMDRLFQGRVSPLVLLSIQMTIGAIIFGALAAVTGLWTTETGPLLADRKSLWLLIFSIVVFVIGSYMIATSIQTGNALLAGLVEISYPLFILVFMLIMGSEEKTSPMQLVGGLMILAGAVIIQTSRSPA